MTIPLSWLVAGVAGIAVVGYGWHCESEKAKAAQFLASVEAAGKAAQKAAELKEKADRREKEKADAKSKADLARIAELSRQLRDKRASTSILSPPSPATSRPHLACFERTEFERATRQLDEGLSAIAERCDQDRVNLDTARVWSNTVLLPRLSE